MYKTSEFMGAKAQGGGIYSVTTKSSTQLMNIPLSSKIRQQSAGKQGSRFSLLRQNQLIQTQNMRILNGLESSPEVKPKSNVYLSPAGQGGKGLPIFNRTS